MKLIKINFKVVDSEQSGEFIVPERDYKKTMELFTFHVPLDKCTLISIEPYLPEAGK